MKTEESTTNAEPIDLDTRFVSVYTTATFPQNGEILEIAVLDAAGTLLFESYVRPYWHADWAESTQKFGVTPADVATAPPLDVLRPVLQAILAGQRLVLFNAPMDACSDGLASLLSETWEVRCAMREFAPAFGDWNTRRRAYRWKSLNEAGRHVGFEWPRERRRARHDALATRAIWQYLEETVAPEQRLLQQAVWVPLVISAAADPLNGAVAR